MSSLEKPNPVAALLKAAAKLPAETGATARFQRRLAAAGSGVVVLADVSASMGDSVGSRRRIDVLREALAGAPPARLIAFASEPVEVDGPAHLPSPAGSTALHLALDLAATLRPVRTLVVSDGEPDSEELALAAAEHVPGTIDVVYCGPEENQRARDFLARLARAGAGSYVCRDITRAPEQLGPAVRALLGPRS